MNANLLLSIK